MCHELGMFPMKVGDRVEDFSRLGKDYLDDVRALHAPRGMVLLQQGSQQGGRSYWNDSRGCELGKMLTERHPLCDKITMGDLVAVLVGYHARFFRAYRSRISSSGIGWEADVGKRLAKLRSPVASLSRADVAFKETFGMLDQAISEDLIRDRLRRQCALIRFVDAIDVSSSPEPR